VCYIYGLVVGSCYVVIGHVKCLAFCTLVGGPLIVRPSMVFGPMLVV
jgi:hypothetical protein